MQEAESKLEEPRALKGAAFPQTLGECHALLAIQASKLEELAAQVSVLSERLKLDSRNSSKPPSSDGPGGGNRAQRRASTRKRGAQKGHPGHYRALVDEAQVDQVVDCEPRGVCECGAAVQAVDGAPIRHQVFEVPQVQAQVSEYRRYAGRCSGCGKAHRGALPVGVPSGQLGPRALALIGTLGTHYHLTQMKIRDLMARLMGVDFSVGAISQAQDKVQLSLVKPVAQMAIYAASAPVKLMDETRYPREGGGNWAWVVATPLVVNYTLMPSRARYVAHDLIGQQPIGVVVSDRYAVYDYVDSEHRQVCWAHLLRDFRRISQRSGQAGRIGHRLLGAGYVLFRWRSQGKPAAQFERLRFRVQRFLEQGTQSACRQTANTCANLIKLGTALWRFLTDAAIPPTNNGAEQALRTIVLKRKISGPTRSRRGDQFIARGFSVYETCRRQGLDLWDFMHDALSAWISQADPPSLIPKAASG